MQDNVLLTQTPLSSIFEQFRLIIREEIELSKQSQLEEKLLSPKEACKLFHPSISRPTLDSLAKAGSITKYHLGGKILFKYSELIGALKSFKKYSQQKSGQVNT